MEQFHSKRSEQLLERVKHLEPVTSSDEEDYSDEVCISLFVYSATRVYLIPIFPQEKSNLGLLLTRMKFGTADLFTVSYKIR